MAIRNESTYFQWQPLVLQRQILFRRLVLHQSTRAPEQQSNTSNSCKINTSSHSVHCNCAPADT